MADSLFDNRYRYDFIYPRGRSGETLRAVDTAAEDRPVVIKRPAPNDAPPIRAGQEVSILNERKALTRLAGHAVLTELLGGGQFFVGGMPHQYIVIERAEGAIIADAVLELAARGERLPQLEMLVIVDRLLDLLEAAHTQDIVYNDVDAKHLFWNRDAYTLKVIDWGNAVFLEGDEVTPQGISRQNDIFQVGELLYFILTGGGRVDVPRDAGDDFTVDFGQSTERVAPRLRSIVSKAVHPNTRLRYNKIADLRRELTDYRQPFERERDAVVRRVEERLHQNLSKNELRGALNTLEPVLALDPGEPAARTANEEIVNRLRDLDVAADLDAVRIYMNSANWGRAVDLLNELRDKAGARTARMVNLLLDCNALLFDQRDQPIPPAVPDAIALMFDEQMARAADMLVVTPAPDEASRRLQWLLAERISSHVPDVLLLRPNLLRLELALEALTEEGGESVTEPQALLDETQRMLDDLPGASRVNLAELRDGYRAVVDRLSTLNKMLLTLSVQRHLSNRQLPVTALERALNATMALADNMHVIGRQATSSPRDAAVALDSSRAIDPGNPLWDAIARLLNNLYEMLQSSQTFVPSADASDLDTWLAQAHSDLSPFLKRLFDDMLAGMVDGLKVARESWSKYSDAVITGNRNRVLTALTRATEAVGTVSPTLAGWFNQLRSVVNGAQYIERHAIQGGLGRALADGWEAFDRGRLPDAERLGQQAFDIARSEVARGAARRLLVLAGTARDWVERNGVSSESRSRTALNTIEEMFTPEEATARDNFAAQMPTRETYLRAMGRGLIETYTRTSSAATRLLFFADILLGTLEAHDANLEDAEFWREAATRALGEELGVRHVATRTLDEFIERRADINKASALLNELNGRHAIDKLEAARRELEENSQARVLAPAVHSLRELEIALRDWADGEFRAAGLKLENAIKALGEAEQSADITLTQYRAWLMELQAASADLHTHARTMRQAVERRISEPVDEVRNAHHKMAQTTVAMLGETQAAALINWRDTYENFLAAYTDTSVRRSGRLSRFNELFRAMFIDRHPAYPLYQHWYDLTERSPEFPAPPTDDPTPRIAEENVAEDAFAGSRYVEAPDTLIRGGDGGGRRLPLRALLGAIVVLLIVAGVIAVVIASGGGSDGGVKLPVAGEDDTPEVTEPVGVGVASLATNDAVNPVVTTLAPLSLTDFTTPTLVNRTTAAPVTEAASLTPTDVPPTDTPTPGTPTHTPTPTLTFTPSITWTPSATPTPTLPPEGLRGTLDLFDLMARLDSSPWNAELFSRDPDGAYWRLGTGVESPEDEIRIAIPADMLEQYYGNNAASRLRRVDAIVSLTSYIPTLLEANAVYFGLMLQSTEDPELIAGIFIRARDADTVDVYLRVNDNETFVRQFSVNAINPRLRLDRDVINGSVTAFFDDFAIGNPIPFVDPDATVVPVLFVQHGGVIVAVSRWQVTLR